MHRKKARPTTAKSGRIRVVAGSAGGLWLSVPPDFPSRPTQDRIKQAMFSSLGSRIPDCRFLDLFAGTGNLGIEALSRGANECVFVEQDPRCCACIQDNLRHCHLQGTVIQEDATAWCAHCTSTFDVIVLDPPYAKEGADLSSHPLLPLLTKLITPHGILVWEHASACSWTSPQDWELLKTVAYGETSLSYLLPQAS